ncbi:hypothetical protein PHYC_02801 [Phycisphaerales bacterium]|nr:hypothetical protein PHYC_02801 [Phycisphaerales bacterium]
MQSEGRIIAVAVALAAFVIAVVAGLGAGVATDVILFRALVAMVICQAGGMAVGEVFARVRAEHAARYIKDHPIPSVAALAPVEQVIEVGEETVEKSQ